MENFIIQLNIHEMAFYLPLTYSQFVWHPKHGGDHAIKV